METKDVKSEIASITPDAANNAKDLPRSARRQFECSRCGKNFIYMKNMEKHKLACKGNTSSLVQMEHGLISEYETNEKPSNEEGKKPNVSQISPTISALKQQLQNPPNKHRCNICDATFSEPHLLQEHHNHHLKIKKQSLIQCHLCFKSYKNRSSLNSHLNSHTSRFKCEHCGKHFQSSAHLEEHIRRHLGIKTHKCTICNQASGSAADLRKHMASHQKIQEKCDICSRTFSNKSALKQHKNIHIDYKCDLCKEAFLTSQCLAKHKNLCHTSLHKPDACRQNSTNDIYIEDESTNADEMEMLDKSEPSNEGGKKLKVPKIYPTISALKQHLQDPHNKHRCNICDATFPEPHLLKEHHNRHLEIKKQSSTQCHLCFKSYQNRSSLLTHLNSHTSRFKCEHCGINCSSAASLEVHIRRHLGIKTYQCTICNKASESVSHLRRHMARHQKNQVKCDICSRTFSNMSALKQHRNIHIRYKCYLCKEAFLTSQSLAKHKNLRHTSLHEPDACRQNSTNDISVEDESTNAINDARRNPSNEMEMHDKSDTENRESGHERVPGSGYKCPVCPKVYTSFQARKLHLNTHTNRFKCQHCDKRFQSAPHLKKHSKTHLRKMQKIKTKNSHLIGIKTEEPASNAAVVEIKVPDTAFEDAICFEDDNEYKLNIDVTDDVTEAKIYSSDLESHPAYSQSGLDNISMVKICNKSTNENTEHSKEVQISAVTFCPIKVEAEEFEEIEIQNKFQTHNKKSMSEEIDSFDGTQHFQPIADARDTPILDGKDNTELSNNLEFLSEDEAPEPIECNHQKKKKKKKNGSFPPLFGDPCSKI